MKIFMIPFRVEPVNHDNTIIPSEFSGGYVSCYSPGRNYEEATEKALKRLIADGIFPAEVLQPLYEMDSADWSQHVSDRWAELVDSLPGQNEFESAMKRDEVVYGPFGMYN